MSAVLERPVVMGSQTARIRVVPDGEDHPRWDEIVAFVKRLGVTLDPWQWDVLRVSLMRVERDVPEVFDGVTYTHRWAAFTVAVCMPRQNGKNAILEIRQLIGACILGERLQVHSAHQADTAKEGFIRLETLIDTNDWLHAQVKTVRHQNGHEQIIFKNGCRIRFRTRTRGGGRGFSGSPIYFDEAMFLSEVSMGSIMPVVSAQPDPQIWYTGSAVDQTIHEDGVAFARVRHRSLTGEVERLAYAEWSLEEDTPDQVEIELPRDLMRLAAANPAIGIRISPDYLEAEMRELDDRTFAVERGGVGDWPPVDGSASQVIPIEKWDALADDPAANGARMLDPVCLAFDTKPDRSASSICSSGRRSDGDCQIELTDHRAGTAWLPRRLAEIAERNDPVAIMVDGAGPAGSLIHECEELGLKIIVVNSADYAKAFGHLLDLVDERGLRHLGSQDLRNAVKGATKRPIGDGAFGWGRRNSAVDISPLVAATLAAWGWSTLGWEGDTVIF